MFCRVDAWRGARHLLRRLGTGAARATWRAGNRSSQDRPAASVSSFAGLPARKDFTAARRTRTAIPMKEGAGSQRTATPAATTSRGSCRFDARHTPAAIRHKGAPLAGGMRGGSDMAHDESRGRRADRLSPAATLSFLAWRYALVLGGYLLLVGLAVCPGLGGYLLLVGLVVCLAPGGYLLLVGLVVCLAPGGYLLLVGLAVCLALAAILSLLAWRYALALAAILSLLAW